jgi:hypothetical protein
VDCRDVEMCCVAVECVGRVGCGGGVGESFDRIQWCP